MIKLVIRVYFIEGFILDLTSFLCGSKGMEDTRIIFYTTVSGMSEDLKINNFILLVVVIILIIVGPDIHMVDLYVKYMLCNFRLSLVLKKYRVLDLGTYLQGGKIISGAPY